MVEPSGVGPALSWAGQCEQRWTNVATRCYDGWAAVGGDEAEMRPNGAHDDCPFWEAVSVVFSLALPWVEPVEMSRSVDKRWTSHNARQWPAVKGMVMALHG